VTNLDVFISYMQNDKVDRTTLNNILMNPVTYPGNSNNILWNARCTSWE